MQTELSDERKCVSLNYTSWLGDLTVLDQLELSLSTTKFQLPRSLWISLVYIQILLCSSRSRDLADKLIKAKKQLNEVGPIQQYLQLPFGPTPRNVSFKLEFYILIFAPLVGVVIIRKVIEPWNFESQLTTNSKAR